MKDLSFSDLYAMYLFVCGDPNNKGFGATSQEQKAIVGKKKIELENELYVRVYGFNPHSKSETVTIVGQKPEDIDLNEVSSRVYMEDKSVVVGVK